MSNRESKLEYLIYAPPYSSSAGIRVMHLLAHHLNTSGYNAFVPTGIVNPDLNVIALKNPEDSMRMFGIWQKQEPIVVYPEIIKDNPTGYKKIVRYILNNPTWGGQQDIQYGPNDIIFAYNQYCQSFCPPKTPILEVPAYDTNIFYNDNKSKRAGGIYWVYKGCDVAKVKDTEGMREITHYWPATRNALADLLRSSEIFYSYDNNTALQIESRLCGCPTVIIPDPSLKLTKSDPMYISESGLAWGNSPDEIKHARETVHLFAEDFAGHFKHFDSQLDHFITITQGM